MIGLQQCNLDYLPAEEALYPHVCKDLFVKGKDLPGYSTQDLDNSKRWKVGRPKCISKMSAFQLTIEYLGQNDDETIILNELHQVMITRSGLCDDEVYTPMQLKRELEITMDLKSQSQQSGIYLI